MVCPNSDFGEIVTLRFHCTRDSAGHHPAVTGTAFIRRPSHVWDCALWHLRCVLHLAAYLPGPGNFALITSTGKGGVKEGLTAIAGVIIGDQILMWLALAGVAVLLKTYPATFNGAQILGSLYLGYPGLRLMLATAVEASVVNIATFHYLRQTLFITLCNPKAVLFYLAFLPLFIDPSEHRGVATFTALALTVSSLTFLYGVIVIGLIRFLGRRLHALPGCWLICDTARTPAVECAV
ncbi:LysE family transporter [Pseudomonas japonica]|uniref:LysE family transporter n=1 Tax=Pseudomonas japonica TaxID=256466 RepID=UPI0015E400B2|nr:LysE family transporter [Pseudomonas japonica]MBA1245414.1 LysE family transporter [Pseudomonas japonica]